VKRDSRGRFVSRTRPNPAPKRNAKGQFVGRTRRNPEIGPIVSVTYRKNGESKSLPPWNHDAGDMGLFKIKSKAKLMAGKGGRLSIRGMRWSPVGIVG